MSGVGYGDPGNTSLCRVLCGSVQLLLHLRPYPYGFFLSLSSELTRLGYEATKRAFARRFQPDPLPVWALLTSGGVGGICYWLACYPLDVVKSRVQLAPSPPSRGGWLEGGYVMREFRAIFEQGGM